MLQNSTKGLPRHLTYLPAFFSAAEQRVLLTTALKKLDAMDSIQHRRRRKATLQSAPPKKHSTPSNPLQDLFLPDEYYQFQEGHFDGVIKNYREMHLSSWPRSDVPELSSILDRLSSLFPSKDTQTHLLHLASNGEIQPHIDNVSASGTWILGCSLGAERLLCLESQDGTESFQALLPSGSVYIQRDDLRFDWKHSIPLKGVYEGRPIEGGQRVSIMIRDRLPAMN